MSAARAGRRLLLVGCAIAVAGCNPLEKLAKLRGRKAADAAAPAPTILTAPPTPQIRETEVLFRETKARVSAFVRGTTYELSFFDFPPSSKITVGGAALVTSPTGFLATKIDLTDRIARLPPKDAFTPAYKIDPQAKLTMEFGPQATLSVDMPPTSVSFALTEALRKVPTAPVAITGGPKRGEHSVVWVGPASAEVLGPAKTMAEVDWVALLERQPSRRGKTCTGYRKAGTGETADHSLGLTLFDEKVSVFEIRTGKPVAQRVIAAPNECPSASIGALKSFASPDEQKRWLRQLVAARR